jgi:hypothetical protein
MGGGGERFHRWELGRPLRLRLLLHELGTQWGTLLLAGLFRVVGIVGVAFRFYVNAALSAPVALVLVAYLVFAVLLLVILLRARELWSSAGLIMFQISLDVVAVSVLHYFTGDSQSDVFFLYLLPCLVAARYLKGGQAIAVVALVCSAHLAVLGAMMRTFGVYPQEWLVKVFVPRQFLLATSTLVCVLHRWLTATVAPELSSPFELRRTLVDFLEELAQQVRCDSASLQLLREDSSEIVACWGFPEPGDVLGLAFPLDDPDFPNQYVFSAKGAYIVKDTTESFPSFGKPQYCASEIKSWLGVPLIAEWTGEKLGMISLDGHAAGQFGEAEGKAALRHARDLSGWLGRINLTAHALLMQKELIAERQFMDGLVDVIRWLGVQQSLAALVTHAVQGAAQAFGVEDCSLALHDSEENTLTLVASSALPRDIFSTFTAAVTMAPHMGLEAYSLATGETLNLSADECPNHFAWNDVFSKREAYLRSQTSRGVLVTPVRGADGEPRGVLLMQNARASIRAQRFPHFAERLFDVFASWVGVAISRLETPQS